MGDVPGLVALRAALDLLDGVELESLSDGELHAVVVATEKLRSRLGVVAGRFLQRWDVRHVWATDGSRSASARLARDTNSAPASAAVTLRRARQQPQLPATVAAITRGDLSLDHLDLLGRANQDQRIGLFARDESMLVATCARLRFTPAIRAVQYWCQRADHYVGAEPATDGHSGEVWASTTSGGRVVVHGTLGPIGGAAVTAELRRLERQQRLNDERRGTSRTPAERRAAALVEMATRSASSPANGRRPQPLFTVLVGDATFRDLCELANGTVIPPAQLVPWLSSAELETILFDGPLTVLGVSRRRSFAGALRRAVEVRDRHCQHPAGCDVPAPDCDVDHIVPRHQGGPTSQFNGRLQCTSHNRRRELHDHDAVPFPDRAITRLDVLRGRLRC